MEIPRSLLLDRLSFLESGRSYPLSQQIPLKSRLYSSYLPISQLFRTETATGHIPFSEAVECPYQPVAVGSSFGPLWSTFWFKLEFTVPEEVTNELHLIWDSDSEALLYSETGKPIQGLNGRSYCIVDNYARRYTYYVEAAGNNMFGEDVYPGIDRNKTFTLKECRIGLFRRDIWDLMWDYQTLLAFAKELPDTPRGEKALFLANQITDLDRMESNPTAECRKLAESFLAEKTADNQSVVIAVGHCHIDTAWLWRYEETKRKVQRSWRSQLTLMKYYPEYTFCASAALHYHWMRERDPEGFCEIQHRVEEGRWQIVGGAWVEFDGNLPGGEAMARQLLYGQRYFKQLFGTYCKVFFLPDTFGYSPQLPQLISSAQMPFFITQKLCWNNINPFPHTTFLWSGLDGTQVLTHFPPANTYCAEGNVGEVLNSVKNNKEKGRNDIALLLFGFGDGGGGPISDHLERLKRVRSLSPLPKVEMSQISDMFARIDPTLLPIWYGELYFELHRGTYTTMATMKQLNRQLESQIRQLEILNVLERRYTQEKIRELYLVLLQNQFHDVLPGSSIEAVYTDSVKSLTELQSEIQEMLESCENYRKISLLNHYFEEVILENGDFRCIKADPFGSITEFHSEATVRISRFEAEIILENQFLIVKIDDCGLIQSLVLKKNNRESLASPGNELALYDDLPLYWDAWDLEAYHSRTRKVVNGKGELSVKEDNGKCVEVCWSCQLTENSLIVQTFRLTSLSQYLLISSEVLWGETHKVLKAEFASSLSASAVANYETQFGFHSRPTHWNTSWDVAKFEVSAQRWMHLGEYNFGLGIINNSKYGMNIHSSKLSLTLLKSPKAPNPTADMGKHHFAYALYPHCDSLQSSNLLQIAELVNSFTAYQPSEAGIQLITNSSLGVQIEAVKFSESGNEVILRAFEALGGSETAQIALNEALFGSVKSVFHVDLLEERPVDIGLSGNGFQYHFQPFQVATFKISFKD